MWACTVPGVCEDADRPARVEIPALLLHFPNEALQVALAFLDHVRESDQGIHGGTAVLLPLHLEIACRPT